MRSMKRIAEHHGHPRHRLSDPSAGGVACEIEGMGGLGERVVAIFAQIIHSTREPSTAVGHIARTTKHIHGLTRSTSEVIHPERAEPARLQAKNVVERCHI
ncbi:hypothetical protein [Chromobacterium violaceum]|uniref:hypothetical protein n=2 Tax=Chromobacterium violaceum TaxID=536 RepID=UPI0012FE51B5|nr:hypothetical protein [Chromobacterium violaceum]